MSITAKNQLMLITISLLLSLCEILRNTKRNRSLTRETKPRTLRAYSAV